MSRRAFTKRLIGNNKWKILRNRIFGYTELATEKN